MEAEVFATLKVFEGLSDQQLRALAPLFVRALFSAGEHVFEAGDEANLIYVVETGEVSIRFGVSKHDSTEIARIPPGGVFGWSAALGRSHYTSSAVCSVDTQTFAAYGSDLRQLIHADPQLGALVLECMANVAASRMEGLASILIKLIPSEASEA